MNKVMLVVAMSSAFILSGCSTMDSANESKIDTLKNKFSELKQKVDDLSSKVKENDSASNSAKESAERANERIDNLIKSYKK